MRGPRLRRAVMRRTTCRWPMARGTVARRVISRRTAARGFMTRRPPLRGRTTAQTERFTPFALIVVRVLNELEHGAGCSRAARTGGSDR